MIDKKLKIAYIIQRFYPFKGGAEQNIYALATRMAEMGHDVTIITTNVRYKKNEPLPYRENHKGIKIVRNWTLNDALYMGFYPSLLPYLLFHHFDIVHTSGIGFIWREFCLIIKKILSPKTKFITTPHGPFMALNDTKGFRGFSKSFYTKILRIFLPWLYDIVIKVNPRQDFWMNQEYRIPKNKIVLIPNGIDQSYVEKTLIDHKPDEPMIISYMNRWEYYKGSQNVIKALTFIRDNQMIKDPKVKLPLFYLMGRPGNYTKELYKLVQDLNIKDQVKFIESPSDDERDRIFYYESQVNILPSLWEAYGITVVEAMAKGNVPICTTGNEGAEMYIQNGVNGFIYDFEDIKGLAEIIVKLLDYDLRQKMRQLSLEKAKNLTWEAIMPEYVKLLRSLK